MNYRELVFRFCDVNVYKNGLSPEARLNFLLCEASKMREQGYSQNFIQNEEYEEAFFNILTTINKSSFKSGRVQFFDNVLIPCIQEAGVNKQDIILIKRAFDERKLLIADNGKKKNWADEESIPVLKY